MTRTISDRIIGPRSRWEVPSLAGVMCVLALLLHPVAAAPSGSAATTQASQYHGWATFGMSNGLIELQVLPEVGGRIIQFKLGRDEFLWANEQLAGKLPLPSGLAADGNWFNCGGDKLWPAPQGWGNDQQWPGPPDAVLDGQPYALEKIPGEVGVAAVRLTSREDLRSGIQFSRVIRVLDGSTRVSFDATMKNIDRKARRWGIWAHTQLNASRADGAGPNLLLQGWCPLNPNSRFAKGYSVIFGAPDHPAFQPEGKPGLMRVQYQYQVGKIGLDSDAGWVATINGENGSVFVQRFRFEPGKAYPDGSSVEFWLNGTGQIRAYNKDMIMSTNPADNPYVMESEILSPFAELQPGESYSWHYDWYAAKIGGNYPVIDCSDVGLVSEPLHVELLAGKLKLKGRFGVFMTGTLRAEFLDAKKQTIGRADVRQQVSPLEALVLNDVIRAPRGIAAVKLLLSGSGGKSLGELAQAKMPQEKAGLEEGATGKEATAGKPEKPNILLVLADDATFSEMPLFGGKNLKTPNVDRFAGQGLLFRKAYAGTAMCTPCRTELYTGLYPARSGVCWNHAAAKPGTRSIAQHLRDIGYRVGIAGKSDVRPRTTFPFEMVEGFERNCIAQTADYNCGGISDFMTREDAQPFCLIVGLVVPHAPWTVGNATHFDPAKLHLPPYMVDTPESRRAYASYLAEYEVMDRQFGDILKTLDETGRAAQTVVIFTSEQGGQWPGCKWTLWEQGLHTALIARWPAHIQPRTSTGALIQYADLVPTLLEIAGADPMESNLDGTSFLSVLLAKTKEHRKYVYAMHNNLPDGPPYPIRSVSDGRFRYIRNMLSEALYFNRWVMASPDGPYWLSWVANTDFDPHARAMVSRYMRRPPEELYDIEADAYETNNLAADAQFAATKATLAAELDTWMRAQKDPGAELDTEQKVAENQLYMSAKERWPRDLTKQRR